MVLVLTLGGPADSVKRSFGKYALGLWPLEPSRQRERIRGIDPGHFPSSNTLSQNTPMLSQSIGAMDSGGVFPAVPHWCVGRTPSAGRCNGERGKCRGTGLPFCARRVRNWWITVCPTTLPLLNTSSFLPCITQPLAQW